MVRRIPDISPPPGRKYGRVIQGARGLMGGAPLIAAYLKFVNYGNYHISRLPRIPKIEIKHFAQVKKLGRNRGRIDRVGSRGKAHADILNAGRILYF